MAEKESFEKIVNIPLRDSWLAKPRNDRTKRAIYEIRQYAFRHAKADDVKLSKAVNELLWRHGRQKPRGNLRVKLTVSGGVAKVMLPDEKEEARAEEKKGAVESLKDRLAGKPSAPKPAATKAEPAEEKAVQPSAAKEAPAPPNTPPKKQGK